MDRSANAPFPNGHQHRCDPRTTSINAKSNSTAPSSYILNAIQGFDFDIHLRAELFYGPPAPVNDSVDRNTMTPASKPPVTGRRLTEKNHSKGKPPMKLPAIEHTTMVVRTMQRAKASAREPNVSTIARNEKEAKSKALGVGQSAKVELHPPKDLLRDGYAEMKSRTGTMSSPDEGYGKLAGFQDFGSALLGRRREARWKQEAVEALPTLGAAHIAANARIDELDDAFRPTLEQVDKCEENWSDEEC